MEAPRALRMQRNLTPDLVKTIRLQRRRKGMSQSQLGRLLHMPQSQIARIERGSSDVRHSTIVDIARALDLEPMLIPKHLTTAVRYMIADKPDQSSGVIPKLVGNEPEDLDNEER